jgi:nucleoside-diphosphate-sugar epimerase
MKMLLTGATGFLGKIVLDNLKEFDIISLGRKECDINVDFVYNQFVAPQVDVVLHSAGKAHVIPKTKDQEEDFFKVNVNGTKNLLISLEKNLPKYFIFISTVAVYGRSSGSLIKENSCLSAMDPYGKSKIEAEFLIQEWCSINNVVLCIFRLPLIAGTNPPGNLGSMIKAIKKGFFFNISKKDAKKSIVSAYDLVKIIPTAMKMGGIYNLTDGNHPSINDLSLFISYQLGKQKPIIIPYFLALVLARFGDLFKNRFPFNSVVFMKLTSTLTFDDSLARNKLNWRPTPIDKNFKFVN